MSGSVRVTGIGRRFVVGTLATCGLVGCTARRTAMHPDAASAGAASTPHCFDTTSLDSTDRVAVDRLLLRLGDGEALYTLAGGPKPVSSDLDVTVRIVPTVDSVALASLATLRRRVEALACGEVGAFVQVYSAAFPTTGDTVVRAASVIVHHRARLRQTIAAHAAFFARLGVTPDTDPRDIVFAVETAPRADRWRGYGHLFGYPDEAVDFFVRAGVVGDSTRTLVPRDFRRIPTVRRVPATRGAPPTLATFVYAVPKDAPLSPGDRALAAAAAPIHAAYVARRARAIGADSLGALAMWRAWVSGR